jgi:hypothetical protein
MAGNFILRNNAKIVICPAVASLSAPTRAELNAGVTLMAPGRNNAEAVTELAGWELANNPANSSDGDSDFDKTVPGTFSMAESSYTIKASKGVRTVRNALAIGSFVYAVHMYDGDVVGYPCSVFPFRVKSNSDMPTLANEVHKYKVSAAFEGPKPVVDAVVPA